MARISSGVGVGLSGCDGLGDADGEQASRMQCLTQGRVIDPKIPRHRVDPEPRGRADTVDGALDLVKQGQHIAGIARIALGHTIGKDKARGRFRHNTGLSTKLGGAIALPFEDGGNGGIVGIDDFTVAEFLALGEPP